MLLLSFAGNFDAFMQKEIFEQPESVVNTMRGRICFDTKKGDKGTDSQSYVLACPTKWLSDIKTCMLWSLQQKTCFYEPSLPPKMHYLITAGSKRMMTGH